MNQVMSWEWIAGFFEGEGHIYWQEGIKGTKHGTGAHLVIGQVCKEPLEAIRQFLFEAGIENPRLYLRHTPKDVYNKSDIWILEMTRRGDVILFLRHVRPLLYQKREKAELVIKSLERLDAERKRVLEEAKRLRDNGLSWQDVCKATGVGRIALSNYLRADGIDPHTFGKENIIISWRRWRASQGLCSTCGQPRGDQGTKWFCRACANERNERTARLRKVRVDSGLCILCGKERGINGTMTMCRQCADERNEKRRGLPHVVLPATAREEVPALGD